ncbi:hypothetical protein JW968_00575 [Candidatus Woesearchaeota archaeon]|nr:hypothetical protein [Candidatus Woesearchaeota archaeon]
MGIMKSWGHAGALIDAVKNHVEPAIVTRYEAISNIKQVYKEVHDAAEEEHSLPVLIRKGKLNKIKKSMKHEDELVEAVMHNLYNTIRIISVQIVSLKQVMLRIHADNMLMAKLGLNKSELADLELSNEHREEVINKWIEEMVQRLIGTEKSESL